MSKALQWLIGIGVVLIVVAVIAAGVAPYVLRGLAVAPRFVRPMGLFGRHMPFHPGVPFVMGGRMPFMGFFGLTQCLWPLLLVGLMVLAISLLSRRPTQYAAQPPVGAAMPAAPQAPAPAVAPASQAVCSNCGQPLQAGWRHCPNCGTPVA